MHELWWWAQSGFGGLPLTSDVEGVGTTPYGGKDAEIGQGCSTVDPREALECDISSPKLCSNTDATPRHLWVTACGVRDIFSRRCVLDQDNLRKKGRDISSRVVW